MLIIDQAREITLVNRKAEALFGYPRDELIGQTIEILVPERARAAHPEHVRAFFADPKTRALGVGRELVGRRKDGTEVPVEIGLSPIETPEGPFTLASIIDITGRRAADDAGQQMAALVASADDAILMKSLDGTIRTWNPGAERLLGYRADEIIGQSVLRLIPNDRLDEETHILAQIRLGERVSHLETVRRRKDGSLVDVSLMISPMRDSAGNIVGASKIMRDISGRKRSEDALLRSHAALEQLSGMLERQVAERTSELEAAQRHLNAILDAMPSMIGYWDAGLINRFANKAYLSWFGAEIPDMVGRHMQDLTGPDLWEHNRPYVEGALRGEPQNFERTIPQLNGQGVRHMFAHYRPDVVEGVVRGFHVLVHDITEITENRQRLAQSWKEREILLQEIHHRVKNNMAVISSLLNMQMRRMGAGEGRDAIEECRRRVMAIALIHEQLYQSRDYASVHFAEYMRTLASNVFNTGRGMAGVRLDLAVDDIAVDVGLAIPCALVINELITNALKHAFQGRSGGTIRIAFSRLGATLCLEVSDDGVGLPEGFDIHKTTSMGMQVVAALAAQLDATLEVDCHPGTTFRLTFPGGTP